MYYALGHRLPRALSVPLYGDRERFGLVPDRTDPSWIEWSERQYDFYVSTQRDSVGLLVNRAGYRIMRHVALDGATVLEIGPADITHIPFWSGRPKHWVNLDYRANLLEIAAKKLDQIGVSHEEVIADPDERRLPFPDATFDLVVTFYAMEHFHPLQEHLTDLHRVLKPGGRIAGAVPCEGGLAWGMGRYLTSRRWIQKNTSIDLSRIICWEHPNFADHILNQLKSQFTAETVRFWPMGIPLVDVNLVSSFVFRKGAG